MDARAQRISHLAQCARLTEDARLMLLYGRHLDPSTTVPFCVGNMEQLSEISSAVKVTRKPFVSEHGITSSYSVDFEGCRFWAPSWEVV